MCHFTLRHFFGKQVLVHVRFFLRNSSENIENSVIIYPHLLTPSNHLQMTYIWLPFFHCKQGGTDLQWMMTQVSVFVLTQIYYDSKELEYKLKNF